MNVIYLVLGRIRRETCGSNSDDKHCKAMSVLQ